MYYGRWYTFIAIQDETSWDSSSIISLYGPIRINNTLYKQ